MFPQLGFVDTINDYSNVNHDSSLAKIFINPYAAVPSMHCAFAMMIGATGVLVCRHCIAKACWAVWPLLVSWVTIVTAQPLLGRRGARLDGARSPRSLAALRLARARPEAWSFRAVPPRGARPERVARLRHPAAARIN